MDGEIAPAEVEELLDEADDSDVRVVDIRPERAFELGHIPGSVNIPFHALAQDIDSLDGADRVVAVCPHGKSSVQAARLIASYEGIDDDARVESMAGGLDEWESDLEATDASADAAERDAANEGPEPDAPF